MSDGTKLRTLPGQSRQKLITDLLKEVDRGRSVVPLFGAGVSVEAGVPTLAEITRYLAKTKIYLRHEVYRVLPHETHQPGSPNTGRIHHLPALRTEPWKFLRDFGWPNYHELNAQIWHWLLSDHDRDLSTPGDKLRSEVNLEIFESLAQIDHRFVEDVLSTQAEKWSLRGNYWKILLADLTRSSPDLVDALFQQLTRWRRPATTQEFLALLTPILRLRLFLTINFDTLLEDALRAEGFQPTIFDVPEGRSLPYPKLTRQGLSIIKLHGGSFGLMVGDKLDIPLDEETRKRFRAHLPKRPILLVMGVGGWDQRVLDMVELVLDCDGDVFWLHFEAERPRVLIERFKTSQYRNIPSRLRTQRVQDPGAFLREVYYEATNAHPSSSKPFKSMYVPPVLEGCEADDPTYPDRSVLLFQDCDGDYDLGASGRLARLVPKLAHERREISPE